MPEGFASAAREPDSGHIRVSAAAKGSGLQVRDNLTIDADRPYINNYR